MFRIIGADGQQYGPVSAEQLRQWIAEGRANAQTQAQAEGTADWKPLGQFAEFAPLFSPSAVPPTVGRAPQPPVPNYLVPAILCTIFCCLPFGIAAIVFAAQVNAKLQAGDVPGAIESSRKARMWCWIAFWLGIVFTILSMGVVGIGGWRRGLRGW
ncbi:MAG TPA: CD225/dispanin family protein [Verrucomicrobiae bacterium]|nr:CD225/dispanin family protein [Verrucomicrobiae bacterium]